MAVRKQDVEYQQEGSPMKRSRITIDVSPELRQRIKIAALKNDLSISEYVGSILDEAVPYEANETQQYGHPVTPEAIEELNRLREQIARENKGGPFANTTELLRQQREERTRELMGEL